MRLLIEGDFYLRVVFISLGSWQIAIRYMQAIELDDGSSTRSLSVLLLAVEMSLRTQTGLE